MKEYIAMCHVGPYTPGEIIRDLPEDAAERLLRMGAVREAAPVFPESEAEPEAPAEAETGETETEEPEAAPDPVLSVTAPKKKTAARKKGAGK
jgi:hypothetical protein